MPAVAHVIAMITLPHAISALSCISLSALSLSASRNCTAVVSKPLRFSINRQAPTCKTTHASAGRASLQGRETASGTHTLQTSPPILYKNRRITRKETGDGGTSRCSQLMYPSILHDSIHTKHIHAHNNTNPSLPAISAYGPPPPPPKPS